MQESRSKKYIIYISVDIYLKFFIYVIVDQIMIYGEPILPENEIRLLQTHNYLEVQISYWTHKYEIKRLNNLYTYSYK